MAIIRMSINMKLAKIQLTENMNTKGVTFHMKFKVEIVLTRRLSSQCLTQLTKFPKSKIIYIIEAHLRIIVNLFKKMKANFSKYFSLPKFKIKRP